MRIESGTSSWCIAFNLDYSYTKNRRLTPCSAATAFIHSPIEDINDAIEEFTEIQPEHCHRITVLNGSEEDVEECSVIYVGSDSEEDLCQEEELLDKSAGADEECFVHLRHGKWYPEFPKGIGSLHRELSALFYTLSVSPLSQLVLV